MSDLLMRSLTACYDEIRDADHPITFSCSTAHWSNGLIGIKVSSLGFTAHWYLANAHMRQSAGNCSILMIHSMTKTADRACPMVSGV